MVDLVVQDLIVLVNFGYVSRVLNFFLVPLSYDSIALTKQLLFVFTLFLSHVAAVLLVFEVLLPSICFPSIMMQLMGIVSGAVVLLMGLF